MGFCQEWEAIYKGGKHLSVWPWNSVVSLTHRFYDLNKNLKVLELGCGAGANIPYFASFDNIEYYGLEGSQSIVEKLQSTFRSDKVHIGCADFTKTFYFDEIENMANVDIIIDRSSVTHNKTADIKSVIEKSLKCLKSGGKYMGFDWFGLDSEVLNKDKYTKIDDNTFVFEEGYYCRLGNVHFSDDKHIQELFADFNIEYLVKNTNTQILPTKQNSSSYNFVMSKK